MLRAGDVLEEDVKAYGRLETRAQGTPSEASLFRLLTAHLAWELKRKHPPGPQCRNDGNLGSCSFPPGKERS